MVIHMGIQIHAAPENYEIKGEQYHINFPWMRAHALHFEIQWRPLNAGVNVVLKTLDILHLQKTYELGNVNWPAF